MNLYDDTDRRLSNSDNDSVNAGPCECRCSTLAPDVRMIVMPHCPVRQGEGPDCIVDLLMRVADVDSADTAGAPDRLI